MIFLVGLIIVATVPHQVENHYKFRSNSLSPLKRTEKLTSPLLEILLFLLRNENFFNITHYFISMVGRLARK
jgi:hypothetical protein